MTISESKIEFIEPHWTFIEFLKGKSDHFQSIFELLQYQ